MQNTPENENEKSVCDSMSLLGGVIHDSSLDKSEIPSSDVPETQLTTKNDDESFFSDDDEEDDVELILEDKDLDLNGYMEDDFNKSNATKTVLFGSTTAPFGSYTDRDNSVPAVSVNKNINKSLPTTTQIPKLIKTVNDTTSSMIDPQNIIQIDNIDNGSKPWNQPSADITDYFNYGFNEENWKIYCEKQKFLRYEPNNLNHSNMNFHPLASSFSGPSSNNTYPQSMDLLTQIVKLLPDNAGITQKLLSNALPGIFNMQNVNRAQDTQINIESLINAAEKCKLPSELIKAFLIMALSGIDLPPNTRVETPPVDFSIPTVDSVLLYNQMSDVTNSFQQPLRNPSTRQNTTIVSHRDNRSHLRNNPPNNNDLNNGDVNSLFNENNSNNTSNEDIRRKPSNYNRYETRKRDYDEEKRTDHRSHRDVSSSHRSRRAPSNTSSRQRTIRSPYKPSSTTHSKHSRTSRRRSSAKHSSRRRQRNRISSYSRSRSYSRSASSKSSRSDNR